MPDPNDRSDRAQQYAVELSNLARQDADQVAARLQYGSRAVAVQRFARMWPDNQHRPARRALQRWYLYAFEQHLAEPVAGTIQTIDSQEAGRVLAIVSDHTGADPSVILGLITTLAHDARALARETAIARGRLIEAGLNGRITTLFPPRREVEVGLRQAISEQWYARSFRAVIGPKLFGEPTAPVTPAEVYAVGRCLAADRALTVHQYEEPIDFTNRRWREDASWQWANQPLHRRQAWLRRQGYDPDLRPDLTMASFGRLPAYLQSRLLEQTAPSRLDLGLPITDGTPREQAATMFEANPVRPATAAEITAQQLIFRRGGGAIPPEMITEPADAPLLDALRQLRDSNQRGRQAINGLGYLRHWWSDPRKVDQAVQMRLAGTDFQDIAQHLGISPQLLRAGLARSNVDREALRQPIGGRERRPADAELDRNRQLLQAQRGSPRNREGSPKRTAPEAAPRRSAEADRGPDSGRE